MPRGPRKTKKTPTPKPEETALPRKHMVEFNDDQSRIAGLLWDRFMAELVGDIASAIEIAGCIHQHVVHIQNTQGSAAIAAMYESLKLRFDALWEIHGCACGNPDCGHNKDNPDNTLGGFSGLDIPLH